MNLSHDDLQKYFRNPPEEYWPRTRWWWPGNAATKEEIAWELREMHEKGIGGVEICSVWKMYEKGNIPYLSEEWLEMIKYTIQKAKELKMSVSLTFGPGWTFGGFWVKPEDRSKSLVPVWEEVDGPKTFKQEIPGAEWTPASIYGLAHPSLFEPPPVDWMKQKLVALVAGRIVGDRLDKNSLTDLTSKVKENRLEWEVPDGRWRIIAFWLRFTGQVNQAQDYKPENWSLDHFKKEAVERYCNYLGGKFYEAFGEEFGKTVDSFFCDSFEVMVLPNGIYWSDELLNEFKKFKGYDLAPYLPAVWWDIGELTPRIRYDVNEFLHHIGINWFFKPFIKWCEKHNVKARIQPHYRFTEEIVQGAGITHIPECEVTRTYFDVVMIPRKSVSSGAHLYGQNIISAEAYTFTHQERYRTTLEELKIATDGFVRDGVNRFYNHGYPFSPERDVAPTRQVPFANLINHQNVWWKYYGSLARYISRLCYMLRQGEFVADVAVYSPQATAWTERVVWGFERRMLNYGDLGRILVMNGYDFDIVNDDILQNHAEIQDGKIKVRNMEYKFLIMPNIKSIPLKTLKFIREFVKAGGILIALDSLPTCSVGLKDYEKNDEEVRRIVKELFEIKERSQGGFTFRFPRKRKYGQGYAYRFSRIINRTWSPGPKIDPMLQEFLNALRDHLSPDFAPDPSIDPEGMRESEALTFIHRRIDDVEVYFVTNIRDKPSNVFVTFRVKGKLPEEWNPYTGRNSRIFYYCTTTNGIRVPIRLEAYESTFIVFKPGDPEDHLHVTATNLVQVEDLTESKLTGWTEENGLITVTLKKNEKCKTVSKEVTGLPAPYTISGIWKLTLEGKSFPKIEKNLVKLVSWVEDHETEHFSGTGRYEIDFDLPSEYIREDIKLSLDLGKVGNVAEVELNGKKVGTAWMRPYKLDITEAVKQGRNHLVVLVTNTLINRVSGFKEPPPVPKELVPRYGSGSTNYTRALARITREIGFKPLPPSGLMGPVRIIPTKKVIIPLTDGEGTYEKVT